MAWLAEERVIYNPKQIGKKFEQVSSDYIETSMHKIVLTWHRSSYTDLYIWVDQNTGRVVRQQLSCLGLIAEWNKIQGTKTGFIVEKTLRHGDEVKIATEIVYDKTAIASAIQPAIEILKFSHSIPEKEVLLHNWYRSPKLSKVRLLFYLLRFFKKKRMKGKWFS